MFFREWFVLTASRVGVRDLVKVIAVQSLCANAWSRVVAAVGVQCRESRMERTSKPLDGVWMIYIVAAVLRCPYYTYAAVAIIEND